MPWHIERRDDQFCVIKDEDDSNEGCHDSREEAEAHMRALYANEPNAESDAPVDLWDGAAAMRSAETAADYRSICALDRGASITALRQRFGLPHHPRPGAPPDRQGVRAALAALGGARTGEGMSGAGVAAARAHLERHARELGIGEAAAESVEGITFDDPIMSVSFQVNPEKRTITGLLVPWGKVAKAAFRKWRFARGSLHWSDESRIKLNFSHDRKQPVAYAVRLQDVAAGLSGTFKVARGEEGDRALSLAEDRVFDGFSIEADFEDGDGWVPDPEDEEVHLVQRARLKGVALTGYPAFDDARVERIVASREERTEMTEEVRTEQDGAEAAFETALERLTGRFAESQTKLTENLAESLGESISAGMKTALEEMGSPERREVRAARYQVTREEPVYRFDGSGHSLVRDAWYAEIEKDIDARDRIMKFRMQRDDYAKVYQHSPSLEFAPQTTSTASQIIPPGYRPDLYVDELTRGRPFVNAASRGTIANATPFTVPVFSSSSGGAADHVEGTNPSDGSLTFATKTVTPQAVSGRMVLSREIIDSANPAIDQIALATMREDYARDTEAKVYTLLNGASGAGGTITSGFVPSGAQASTTAGGTDNQTLVKHIRTRLADYGFARFLSPTVALMGQGATGRLAAAVDTAQRPLFPWVGPQNAFGQGAATQASWNIDGVPFVPAWANTGVAAGDSQIMILNRADLWVWESPLLQFRFEEKQGPANIELNIFGYFATHLLRPVGLSGIRIT